MVRAEAPLELGASSILTSLSSITVNPLELSLSYLVLRSCSQVTYDTSNSNCTLPIELFK